MRSVARLVARAAATTVLVVAPTAASAAPDVAGVGPEPVVVTFTFDDGWANQLPAARVLTEHSMAGTFYVNSGMTTFPAYLDRRELRGMISAGHEIGGHTLTHPHLDTISTADRRREICDDRANLQNLGASVTAFAYPYGYVDDRLRAVVEACGYSSARLASGLADAAPRDPVCDCVARLPFDGDRWAVKVKPTVTADDGVEQLKTWVRQAERIGGWVPLVFHRICDDCATESTSLADFTAFVDWLDDRPASTRVLTVSQVLDAASSTTQPAQDVTAGSRRLLRGGQAADVPTGGGRDAPTEYAFTVAGYGVGQMQVVLSFIGVALIVSLGFRWATRGRRFT